MKPNLSRVMSPSGDITLLSFTNSSGASVTLSTLGAGITRIRVPDRHGIIDDVILGYKNPVDYIEDGPCAGKTIGRFANRISNARFCINEELYKLNPNDGKNALHGGRKGFMNQIWDYEVYDSKIIFRYTSENGEEGYPGKLNVTTEYIWNNNNELHISYHATTDSPTIVNLTNHAYFNLNGENSGDILDHILHLFASSYLPVDTFHIPTGEIADTINTPMDFTTPKKIGQDINSDFSAIKIGRGYNHFWIIDNNANKDITKAAELLSEKSGRKLEILTTHHGIQVYSGGWLNGSPKSISGRSYNNYDGIALECQGYTDAPNHSNFPSAILIPGQEYHHKIVYRFSTF